MLRSVVYFTPSALLAISLALTAALGTQGCLKCSPKSALKVFNARQPRVWDWRGYYYLMLYFSLRVFKIKFYWKTNKQNCSDATNTKFTWFPFLHVKLVLSNVQWTNFHSLSDSFTGLKKSREFYPGKHDTYTLSVKTTVLFWELSSWP